MRCYELMCHVRNEVRAVTKQRHSPPSYCMRHPDATDGLKTTEHIQTTEGGSTLRTVNCIAAQVVQKRLIPIVKKHDFVVDIFNKHELHLELTNHN